MTQDIERASRKSTVELELEAANIPDMGRVLTLKVRRAAIFYIMLP